MKPCLPLIAIIGLSLAFAKDDAKRPLFHVGVETVYVNVSVTDEQNRSVTGLKRQHFKLFEDGIEQNLAYFIEEPSAVSIGILFDVSGSMNAGGNIQAARMALKALLANVNPEDEFFFITFNDRQTVVADWTSDKDSVQREIEFPPVPKGTTALYDALYRGLHKIGRARNDRRALVLVSDGLDNSSRYEPSEVLDFAKESDAQIYAIGDKRGIGYNPHSKLQNIINATGGRTFLPANLNELAYYIDIILSELRTQYVLGYVPVSKERSGKWRRIRIKLDPPSDMAKLSVHAREGYYAPRF